MAGEGGVAVCPPVVTLQRQAVMYVPLACMPTTVLPQHACRFTGDINRR